MSADDDHTSSGPKAAQNARYGRCGARQAVAGHDPPPGEALARQPTGAAIGGR
jgi:hypothetical protein